MKRVSLESVLKIASIVVLNLMMIALTVYYTSTQPQTILAEQGIEVLSKIGSRGDEVRAIQQKLKQWAFYKGSVDGVFGQQTYDAVVRFQKTRGLTADGIAGPQTLRALGLPTGSTSSGSGGGSSGSTTHYSDLELLARIASSEAKGEGHTGMVAVAAVVLNRIKHPSFPDTIAGVIYQAGQFTPVQNGTFDSAIHAPAWDAARDALNGVDPTGGALFFYNPQKTSDAWLLSRRIITTIKNHRFCI